MIYQLIIKYLKEVDIKLDDIEKIVPNTLCPQCGGQIREVTFGAASDDRYQCTKCSWQTNDLMTKTDKFKEIEL